MARGAADAGRAASLRAALQNRPMALSVAFRGAVEAPVLHLAVPLMIDGWKRVKGSGP
jgi:hypothetical protein